jgi:iron complex outermembrane receptor protein
MGAGSAAVPTTVLTGDALTLEKSNSLGELLSRELGVSTTGFGANASRPVIRGLDADRIKVLSNGSSSHDVAALSFDHATPIDPLVIERVEVLRGPATLLFGGGAVGGVINAIDNRIPTFKRSEIEAVVELRNESVKRENSASALLDAPLGNDWALHVDGFTRKSRSARVPIDLACTVNGSSVLEKKVCNTQANADGGAIGVSRFWTDGFVGASLSTYQSTYGTPAEDEVTIAMKSQTLSLKGEQKGLQGWFKSIAAQANSTRYAHTELDAGTPATQFSKRGNDLKLTLEQQRKQWGGLSLTGSSLMSAESERFNALGAEAFVPENKSTQLAIASLQTLSSSFGSLTGGLRLDNIKVTSQGGPQTDYLGQAKFAPAKPSFTLSNFALSSVINVSPTTQLLTSLSNSQRAPTAYELFANGAHIATGAYEIGDVNLRKERSKNLDLAIQWKNGHNTFKVGGFYNQFKNFISLSNTGEMIAADGELNPTDSNGDGLADSSGESIYTQYQYKAVKARFVGLEAQGNYRLLQVPYIMDVSAKFDVLDAKNSTTGEPLPRIAPMRLTLAANARYQGWTAKAEWAHNAKQSKVPATDLLGASDSYNLLKFSLSYRSPANDAALWFLTVDNALNKLAYNAVTINTVRGKAPLAGRNIKLGVQYSF